ncbi:MAG: hypothetical protein EOP82_09215 [Variovorax sp.]|nr:MAG: hypothetical protein EOP82_09215 [Variovorax sp.]
MQDSDDDGLRRREANCVPLAPLGFLERAAKIYPDKVAVVHDDRRITYAELYRRCKRLASALSQIRMPVLNVFATGDVIIPVSCSQGMEAKFGTDDDSELSVPGGHIGTFVGGKAQKVLAPSIAKWLRERNQLPSGARSFKLARSRAP